MYTFAFQIDTDQTIPLKDMPSIATETTNRRCPLAEVAAFVLSKGLPSPPTGLEAEAEAVAEVGVDAECEFEDVDGDEVVTALAVDEYLGFAVVVCATPVDPIRLN